MKSSNNKILESANIRTPDQRLRIFVSSTLQELAEERRIVKKAIEQLHLIPVLFELGARPHPPRDLYRSYLIQSHIFIGIYWQRYGWIAPEMDISGLEDEYILSANLPRLIYVKSPAPDQEPGLTTLLKRMEAEGNTCYKKFSSPQELGDLVANDLSLFLSERFEDSISSNLPPDYTSTRKLTNLPTDLTPFIGREEEVRVIGGLLNKENVHLVTLTGPGGVGKTRLAIRAASSQNGKFEDGIWMVDLAPLSDSDLVAQSIANTFGVREEKGRELGQTLLDYLQEKNLLLILDNCEHIIAGVAGIADTLIRNAQSLCILATSREPLNITGEMLFTVHPLTTPVLQDKLTLEGLMQCEAVRLFIGRAQLVDAKFILSSQNMLAVAQLCSRLDGIPLAIELAAARVRALSVEEIAARLDDRFNILVGNRTTLPRQQTLKALFDWSYALLQENERSLLQRLSIFAGGWTLEAAEEVCSGGSIERFEMLDLLSQLVDKSMVIADIGNRRQRYRFLETIRQFSREYLAESEDANSTIQKHSKYYSALAINSALELWGPTQEIRLSQMVAEHDNLLQALEWLSHSQDQQGLFLEMAVSLWRFWDILGYFSEGRAWIQSALESNPNAPISLRADGLGGLGNLVIQQGEYQQARSLHQQSLALFQELNDKSGIARELAILGEIAHYRGDYDQAVDLLNDSLALMYEIGDNDGIANSIGHLGMIARDRGKYEFAKDLLEESLKLCRKSEDKSMIAEALNNLGLNVYYLCQYTQARDLFDEAVNIYRELNDTCGISDTLQLLGNVAKDQGNYRNANQLYEECLELKQSIGDRRGIAQATSSLAEVALFQGKYQHAVELAEQGLTLFQNLGVKRGIVYSIGVQTYIAHFQGDYTRARILADKCLALASEISAPRPTAYAKDALGLVAYIQGNYTQAFDLFCEAQDIFRKIGDQRSRVVTLVNLARTAYRQGDMDQAMNYLDEGLVIANKLEVQWIISYVLEIMGLLYRSQGNYDRSIELFKESLRISIEQDNVQGIANCLGALAGIAAQKNQPMQAALLFASAEKYREMIGAIMGKTDREEYDHYLELLHNQLDEVDYNKAWSKGRETSVEQLYSEILSW
jgi:predicted ATPase/uncharacterized protein HemY